MSDRDEYFEKMKSQLDQWNAQMGAWESSARAAGSEARTEWDRQVGILKSRVDDFLFRMEELKGASAEAWQEIARGAEQAREAMQDAFDKARERLKNR